MRELNFRVWTGKDMLFFDDLANWDWKDCDEWLKTKKVAVMQNTGLKDKNGKEIYEGDILKKEDSTTPCIVKWTDQNGAYFVLSNSATEKVDWDDCLTNERIRTYGYKIIGNIYKNPELLDK